MKIRIIATNALMTEGEFRNLHNSDSIAFPLGAEMQAHYGVRYEADPPPVPPTAEQLLATARAATLRAITELEKQVTARTWRETITKPTAVHKDTGRTAREQIIYIDREIDILKATP